jgi:hypothetical protein
LRVTLTRTGLIAVIGGAVTAFSMRGAGDGGGGLARWPFATLLFLWPALGGHFVELGFLHWIRPRLPAQRGVQVVGRVIVWLVGGVVLVAGMWMTSRVLMPARPPRWMNLPVGRIAAGGAVGFVLVELLAHLVMQLRGVRNFYDGRG